MTHPPIISKQIRLRHPDAFEVGEGSVVDDFCYFSTRVHIGRYCHVAASCTIAGGRDRLFRFGDFSSLSSGVRIYCSSNDYVRDLVALLPADIDTDVSSLRGDVILDRYTGVGANSVIMPDNHLPEGATVGALSYVPPGFNFEPWSVYAGCPVRKVRDRDRDAVLAQLDRITRQLNALRRDAPDASDASGGEA